MKFRLLKVNKACSENWNKMPRSERGRYCNLCSKKVIDFTKHSPNEILKELKKSEGEICGRLTNKQLNIPIIESKKVKSKSKSHFRLTTGILFATSILTTENCYTQNNDIQPKTEYSENSNQENLKDHIKEEISPKAEQEKTSILVKGKVLSKKTGEVIENVRVSFVTIGKVYSVYTSSTGEFLLDIPSNLVNDENVINISFYEINLRATNSLGMLYEEEDIVLTRKELENFSIYKAEELMMILGGIGGHTEEEVVEVINPIVFYNNIKVTFEEFLEKCYTEKQGFDLENNEIYLLSGEAGRVLYGEDGKYGLWLSFDKSE